MPTHKLVLAAVLAAMLFEVSMADEPKPQIARGAPALKLPDGVTAESLADPKEAKRVAELLEKQYPVPRPEGVRMLLAILHGSQLNGMDGWFGPARTRYTWEWLLKQQGLDPSDKSIPQDKFHGPAALFDRLDRDGDGGITSTDLDWSDRNPYNQQAVMLNRFFRKLDTSGDGKVTREELEAFFKQSADGKDYFTADDLRRAMISRGPNGFSPGDVPSVPILVHGLFASEVGSINEGPRPGDKAPDFTLKTVDGKETVNLSKLIGPKPVVLVLGNFTCGPFRALYPEMETFYKRYKDQATFLMVYVREAHPSDGWHMESNAKLGVKVAQPKTTAERVQVCGQFCKMLSPTMPVVVDEVTDPVGTAYSGMPGRMYVIDPKGLVAYQSGRGPFGFRAGELEQALVMCLLETAGAAKP